MAYPAAPWTLYGDAFLTLHLVEVDRARSLVPPEMSIVSVLPGRTLGGVYFSRYGAGSVLQYSELIVVPALLSADGKIGPWISHIYVDSEESVAGGREIWGLPKELAEFDWRSSPSSQVRVQQAGQPLCSLHYSNPIAVWKQPFAAGSFSQLSTHLLWFAARASLRPGLVSATLEIPSTSSFTGLALGQPWATFAAQSMQLTVEPPSQLDYSLTPRSPTARSQEHQKANL